MLRSPVFITDLPERFERKTLKRFPRIFKKNRRDFEYIIELYGINTKHRYWMFMPLWQHFSRVQIHFDYPTRFLHTISKQIATIPNGRGNRYIAFWATVKSNIKRQKYTSRRNYILHPNVPWNILLADAHVPCFFARSRNTVDCIEYP